MGCHDDRKNHTKKKTSKELEEEYAQNIAAVAFICAACLFNITSDAEKLLVTCHTEYIDEATGNEKTGYLYSVIIPRNLMKTFKYGKFEHCFSFVVT